MEISEVNSKGGCFRLAVEHLRQLQDSTVEALAWLEKSKAFVPDESKTVQELKDALAKSIERETELENALTLSEDSRDGLKKNLAKSVERETALEKNLAAFMARERRLMAYIIGLATEAESILEDVKKIGRILPDVTSNAEPCGQTRDNSPEACCQNFEECDKQCVPLANYWRNLAKEAEKKGMEHKWNMQWAIPDVTCTTDPVKPRPLI